MKSALTLATLLIAITSPALAAFGYDIDFRGMEVEVLTADGYPVSGASIRAQGTFQKVATWCRRELVCWVGDVDESELFNQSVRTSADGRAHFSPRRSTTLSPLKSVREFDIVTGNTYQGRYNQGPNIGEPCPITVWNEEFTIDPASLRDLPEGATTYGASIRVSDYRVVSQLPQRLRYRLTLSLDEFEERKDEVRHVCDFDAD